MCSKLDCKSAHHTLPLRLGSQRACYPEDIICVEYGSTRTARTVDSFPQILCHVITLSCSVISWFCVFLPANCAEKTIDDYLNAAFVPDSKDKPDRAIIPSEQLPSLPSSNPLIQYAPILHFPWISPHSAQHTAQEVHEDIIYSA